MRSIADKSQLWRITGERNGRLWTMRRRAADYFEARKIAETVLRLSVRDIVLIDPPKA